MKISTILDQIDLGAMALPEFQRGYVWNRNQVRDLMLSLYRRYPVGGLLVWVTKTEQANTRGDGQLAPGSVELILDGQQRITSLYGIIRGKPPSFFEGNREAFSGLYFNLDEENFEFYAPLKMKDNPLWIDVTRLLQTGSGEMIQRLVTIPEIQPRLTTFINRLTALDGIRDVELHVEKVTGTDKTVDIVVDIFNRVNSGGTKLSKGDLALARICAEWPDARHELRLTLERWVRAGYDFEMDWLLRNINTILTGEALFTALKDINAAEFQNGLRRAEKAINYLLNLCAGRLGLDHDRVLGGRYAFPVLSRYVDQRGGQLNNARERDKLLYWYVHSFLWGRFAGSTESFLNKDLAVMEEQSGALDRLIEQLRLWRGNLRIRPENFDSWSTGARFYPLLYMLTRVGAAQDWGTGLPLNAHLLGRLNRLQVHHIFPKSLLYAHGYSRPQVNSLANYCFLTQDTNLQISNKKPEHYFEEIEQRHPGALATQWIPMDTTLWRLENYLDFLAARRELLSQAANHFLDSLLKGKVPETAHTMPITDQVATVTAAPIESEAEEEILLQANLWVMENGLPEGELLYQLTDPETGQVQALLDLAWPKGLQQGLSQPVALLVDEEIATVEAASSAGYRCITDLNTFQDYVRREILAVDTR